MIKRTVLMALPKVGWMSIACWLVFTFRASKKIFDSGLCSRVVVYSPQIVENYQLKSGEGLSVFFVLIWLAGDLANLFARPLARRDALAV